MKDVLGQALLDYYGKARPGRLWIHNTYGRKEEMPVPVYFRKWAEFPELERTALRRCTGRVLDIGAGAGAHALYLQRKGIQVVALDASPGAVLVMRQRGVRQVVQADIYTFADARYDTLLLLMNGIGLCGTLDGLRAFLRHAKALLQPGGQLLFDSSDVAYLYERRPKPADGYYGEIRYEYEYKGVRTDPFTWLYVDRHTLRQIATEEGWHLEGLYEDEYGQYLVRATLSSS